MGDPNSLAGVTNIMQAYSVVVTGFHHGVFNGFVDCLSSELQSRVFTAISEIDAAGFRFMGWSACGWGNIVPFPAPSDSEHSIGVRARINIDWGK